MKKLMPILKKNESRELVDLQTARQGGARVFEPVGEGEAQFLHHRRPGLLHVIAGDRDRVEFRHVARGVLNDVGDDAHRGSRRVDIGVADHELLEDVVLDGPRELVLGDALLLGSDDVAGEHRQHGAVHRHRDAHLVERDAVEEDLHVLDRVDGDAGLADIADDARMVAVVAAMGGEVEGDGEPHLPRLQILAIEAVRILGGREAGILADRPRAVGIHRRPRPAQIGREAGHRAGEREPFEIGLGVERLDGDAFEGLAGERLPGRLAAELLGGERPPLLKRLGRKLGHHALPSQRSTERRRLYRPVAGSVH
jgi:hypothetical protein